MNNIEKQINKINTISVDTLEYLTKLRENATINVYEVQSDIEKVLKITDDEQIKQLCNNALENLLCLENAI